MDQPNGAVPPHCGSFQNHGQPRATRQKMVMVPNRSRPPRCGSRGLEDGGVDSQAASAEQPSPWHPTEDPPASRWSFRRPVRTRVYGGRGSSVTSVRAVVCWPETEGRRRSRRCGCFLQEPRGRCEVAGWPAGSPEWAAACVIPRHLRARAMSPVARNSGADRFPIVLQQ